MFVFGRSRLGHVGSLYKNQPLYKQQKLRNFCSKDYFKNNHQQRLLIENSWLNWTRNAIISSVAAVGMYNVSKEEFLATKFLLATGVTFSGGGTLQYIISLLAFESGALPILWGVLNSSLVFTLYSGAVYTFLKQIENEKSKNIIDDEMEIEKLF